MASEVPVSSFLKSFVWAGNGIRVGARGRNFRVMLVVGFGAVALGTWTGLTPAEWAAVLGCCGLVLGLELVNTAGEALVDALQPEQDPRYGRVKDLLAGAVLLAAVFSAAVGAVIFWPRLF
jgi:diacylglycerol kinase (ATP)